MELVALRIKILRKIHQGQMRNDYPDFNSMPPEVRGNMDWCHFVDQYTAWHYDKLSGFGETDDYNDNPNMQYGVFCVPQAFADEAMKRWPDRVEQIEEFDMEDFYDNRAHVQEVEMIYNDQVLNGLRAKYGEVPNVEPDVLEAFTDATEETKDQRIQQFELKRKLKPTELQKIDILAKMTPNECKALNPDHPAPGINKNKTRYFKDFKVRRGFSIARKKQT